MGVPILASLIVQLVSLEWWWQCVLKPRQTRTKYLIAMRVKILEAL